MKRVQMYVSEEYFGRSDCSTNYLYQEMLKHPDEFQADITTEPDPELARDADIVFCRFEKPLKKDFLRALAALDDGKMFINHPIAKMEECSKRNLRYFIGTDLIPKTCISSDPDELIEFAFSLEGRLISKPVDLQGGKGVERHDPHTMSTEDVYALAERVTGGWQEDVVFQQYIDGVEKLGDKRITVFMYEPINAILRVPEGDNFLCNLSSGGHSEPAEITDRDREVIEGITPMLREKGILWAGADLIGGYLSELNISSPGMLVEADQLYGNTAGRDKVIALLKQYKGNR
ncbi:hypothetical protein ACFL96_09150 [Thermoproteota archaeon]